MGNHALQAVNAKLEDTLCMKIKCAIKLVQLVQ